MGSCKSFLSGLKTCLWMACVSATLFGQGFVACCFASLITPFVLSKLNVSLSLSNVLFHGVLPLLGFFIQPIVGNLSDSCTFRFGRRRIFIFIGAVSMVIGVSVVGTSDLIGILFGDEGDNHIIGTIVCICGFFFDTVGFAFLDVPTRALLNDIVPVKQQHLINFIANAVYTFSYFLFYMISASCTASSNFFISMFISACVVLILSTTLTILVSKEERLEKANIEGNIIISQFVELWNGVRHCPKKMWMLNIIQIVGCFGTSPLNANFVVFFALNIFKGKQDGTADEMRRYNDGMQASLYCLAVYSIVQSVCSLILPYPIRGKEVLVWVVSDLVFGFAAASLIDLSYIASMMEEPDTMIFVFSFFIFSIFGFTTVAVGSVPRALVKKISPPSRIGTNNGILDALMVLAGSSGCGVASLILYFNDNLVYVVIFCVIFLIIAGLLSFTGFYIDKDD